MKYYGVEIGSIGGGQYRYKIKATSAESAKRIALQKHKELGRVLGSSDKVYARRIG